MMHDIPGVQKAWVMVGVMLALLLAALDQTIVATAMPRIVQELNGLEHLSWVFTAYMLSSTVAVPILGKLSDIYGRKYFILGAILVFMLGSALAGQAQSMLQLIIFRAIQGIGGGAIFAIAFSVIGDLFPPDQRGKWQGLFGAVFGLSSVIGPSLGGWITDNASWRWNFYINIPIGLLALAVVGFLMPKIKPDIWDKSIDYIGALFLGSGLVSLLLALVWGGTEYPWGSFQILGLFLIALLSTAAFLLVEQKAKEPILPLDLFKNSVFSVSLIIVFLMGVGMFGAILYVPLFAQLVIGLSATNSGTILTPLTLGMVVTSIATGQIVSRTGRYKWLARAGLATTTFGLYLMSLMGTGTTQGEMILRMIITGAGLGMVFPIFTLTVQNAVEHSKLGIATASTQLFRSVGATVGTAVLGGFLNNSLNSKFSNLSNDPFVQTVARINPQFNFEQIDVNKFQAALTGQGRQMLEAQLTKLPPQVQTQILAYFGQFLTKVKEVFASSITEVFLITAGVMGVAVVASLFLKEVPLRKTHEV